MDETGMGLSHLFPVPVGAQSPLLTDTAAVSHLEESFSAVHPTEELISELFRIMDEKQSPTLTESKFQILPALEPPVPHLDDSTPTLTRDEPKSGENMKSGAQFKCPHCPKGFDTVNAMFGHMRIHPDKGRKGLKNSALPKRKPRPIPDLCNKLTASWTVTKKRSPREVPERKNPEEVMASMLIDMSKPTWNCQSEKRRVTEFSPLEDEVADILIDMPNIIQNCKSQKRRMPESSWLENRKPQNKKRRIEESSPSEDKKYDCLTCNKTFSLHEALGGHCSSHKMPRKNAVRSVSVELQSGDAMENSDRKAHVCEICGKGFPTGYQLGGHKRAHYQKENRVIRSEAPDDHFDLADITGSDW